jgi:hypothetical protein
VTDAERRALATKFDPSKKTETSPIVPHGVTVRKVEAFVDGHGGENLYRTLALTLPCPDCRALAGHACHGRRGWERGEPHRGRIRAAREAREREAGVP